MIKRQVCELQGVSTNIWITPRIYSQICFSSHLY